MKDYVEKIEHRDHVIVRTTKGWEVRETKHVDDPKQTYWIGLDVAECIEAIDGVLDDMAADMVAAKIEGDDELPKPAHYGLLSRAGSRDDLFAFDCGKPTKVWERVKDDLQILYWEDYEDQRVVAISAKDSHGRVHEISGIMVDSEKNADEVASEIAQMIALDNVAVAFGLAHSPGLICTSQTSKYGIYMIDGDQQ